MIDKKLQGKRNRAAGQRFENLVRKDLEKKGWIVDKWSNNIEFDYESDKFYKVPKGTTGLLKPAKHKFRGVGIPMAIGTGFPDFIIFKLRFDNDIVSGYEIIGVESKVNGILDKEEKEKCKWLLNNHVFSKILIAKKIKVGRKIEVEYNEFKD